MSNSRQNDPDQSRTQLDAIKRGLDRLPEEINISTLIPVITPASFYKLGNWVGPYHLPKAADLGITWAVLGETQTMRYVDKRLAGYWESQNIDWRRQAVTNLVRMSKPLLSTSAWSREDGSFYALIFMHPDACGPSRLLFSRQIAANFGCDFDFAIPERSLGIALSHDATASERQKFQEAVKHCFERGTRPVSPKIYESTELSLS